MDSVRSPDGIPDELNDCLKLADENLAARGTPIPERVLPTIFLLLQWEALSGEDGVAFSLEPHKVVTSDWFNPLAKMIGVWYRQRYGQAAQVNGNDALTGFVLVRGTPFRLDLPANFSEPGDQRDTVWFRFADKVIEGESPLTWIHNCPNLDDLEPEILRRLEEDIVAIATDLRFIHTSMIGVIAADDEELWPFFAESCLTSNRQRSWDESEGSRPD